ncbi:MAG: cobyric acid synthase [bacterium]|nr:cobyric acid synthase [bacterium]
MPAALMLQGCGSDVGKSVLVAGLCRLFADRGLVVRPFKPQNMSNNAAVTPDGGEIGRAQALQALACRIAPHVDMNPVLLKPQSDVGAQVVVLGRMAGTWMARGWQQARSDLLPVVVAAFRRLQAASDLVVVEGAGSPAETNLRAGDIANMGFAAAAGVPVVLVGDIDRGHVIAALVGAHAVLDADDRARIAGFVVNKFRGDPALFDAGRADVVRRTGWRDLGMLPWLSSARRLPAEDAVVLDAPVPAGTGRARIVVPLLSRIANFDEFDALRGEPDVDFAFVPPGRALPGDAALVILPGTKATRADLAMLRAEGWDVDVHAHVRRGGRVLGVCGGFQMLGRRVADPHGVEGPPGEDAGLGLLDVDTVLTGDKVLRPVTGSLVHGDARFTGYEMHVGRTTGASCGRPLLAIDGRAGDGALSADGRVAGTYVHGLFGDRTARAALLAPLGATARAPDQGAAVDALLDEVAAACARHLDVDALLAVARGAA